MAALLHTDDGRALLKSYVEFKIPKKPTGSADEEAAAAEKGTAL